MGIWAELCLAKLIMLIILKEQRQKYSRTVRSNARKSLFCKQDSQIPDDYQAYQPTMKFEISPKSRM